MCPGSGCNQCFDVSTGTYLFGAALFIYILYFYIVYICCWLLVGGTRCAKMVIFVAKLANLFGAFDQQVLAEDLKLAKNAAQMKRSFSYCMHDVCYVSILH